MPCVVKPVMSSSGKGQSVVRTQADIEHAWQYAQQGGRAGEGRVIVEGFIHFDYEITLLTVRHGGRTTFCEPIGHLQIDGDYRESWQPQPMSAAALAESQRIAHAITAELGGNGIFGVELFVAGDTIYFSEVSPRPHDTGLVTLISQDLSEFALHARAILGLPIPVDSPARSRRLRARCWSMATRTTSASRTSIARSPNRTRRCGCSANRKYAATAAWACRWRSAARSMRRERRRGR